MRQKFDIGDLIEVSYPADDAKRGIVLETKGYWESADRRKILAVKKCNPDLDLRMVFQAPYNKIYKGSKTTYAAFCDRHKLPWAAFHSIPIEWLT